MLTSMPGRDQSSEGWVSETFAALARMPVDGPDPIVWPYTPYYSGNPFQAVLYGGFTEQGIVAAPTFRADDLRHGLRNWPSDVPLVVHLHWLNQVLAKATTDEQADQALGKHVELLDLLKRRGAKLVWTVHNALPHDTRFEAQEVRLRQDVIDRIDLVHIMSPRTPEMVSEWFTLPPDRLYQCDHPGYHGVYPDWIGAAESRRRLRIPGGARVLLLTGALKPYKGLLELFEAVHRVSAERPGSVVLVVAGKPDDAPETNEFIARAAQHPAVRLLPDKIPDADLQVLIRAADVVAVPYRRSLNSGVLALALTFGRPVLLPANAGSVPLVDDGAAVIYDPDDPGALTDAVQACLTLDLDAAGRAAERAGARIDRATITRKFATDLRRWADTGDLPPFEPQIPRDHARLPAEEVHDRA
jgi:glycosyltransferase involved in cell wall biosynthesis